MKFAISGKMGSGKTFMANYLVSKYEFKKYSFANYLKFLALTIFSIKKEDRNGRLFLQELGILGRLAHVDFWVDKTLQEIDNEPYVIIDDLRFKNEANRLKQKGYTLIRIESSKHNRLMRTTLSYDYDISETDLDDYRFDHTIVNNGSEEDFIAKIEKVMEFESCSL